MVAIPLGNLPAIPVSTRDCVQWLEESTCEETRYMAHTIVTQVCEGIADCVDACPVACIHPGPGKNNKGTDWYWIDFATCIDCGICLQVCPVEGAIVPEERPDFQMTPT